MNDGFVLVVHEMARRVDQFIKKLFSCSLSGIAIDSETMSQDCHDTNPEHRSRMEAPDEGD